MNCTVPLSPCKGRLISFRYDDDDVLNNPWKCRTQALTIQH